MLFLLGKGKMLFFVAMFLCKMECWKSLKFGEIESLQTIHTLTFCNQASQAAAPPLPPNTGGIEGVQGTQVTTKAPNCEAGEPEVSWF